MKSASSQMPLKNISDTARFVALLRSMESERPDAHFKDPYARLLAGEDAGEMLAFLQTNRRFDARVMAVRTQVLDEQILRVVQSDGVDTVLNLGAGLDTRPYRLALPATLRWVEFDLPRILENKEKVLRSEKPRCDLRRVRLDLRERARRREVFTQFNLSSRKTLVLSEGLLMYLTPQSVQELAQDLHDQDHFAFWLADLISPQQLRWIRQKYGQYFAAADAEVHFAPEAGPAFFLPLGWRPVEYRSFVEEARRLQRESPTLQILRWLLPITPERWREERRKSYGCVLLRRSFR